MSNVVKPRKRKPPVLRSYEVWIEGHDDFRATINAFSGAKARWKYAARLKDAGWPVIWKLLRCRSLGGPQSSKEFVRVASMRGLPNVRCGDRITLINGARGVITGHHDAYFEVEFDRDSPGYAGTRGNVHPGECVIETQSVGAASR